MKRYTIYMALGAGVLLSAFALAERQAFTKKIERRAGGAGSVCRDCIRVGGCFSGAPNIRIADERCAPPNGGTSKIPVPASGGTSVSVQILSGAGEPCPDIVIQNSPGSETVISCGTMWTCYIRQSHRNCDGPSSQE